MTSADQIAAEESKKVAEFIATHPDLEGDVELEDISDVEDRIDFIVPQTDDPSTPVFTVRSITLGTFWCILLSFANTALSFRTNAFAVGANVAIILSYPMGLFWAKALPSGNIINPGPFSLKEHVLIYIMASCSGQPYGIDNVVAQVMPDLMGNVSITFIQAFAFVLVTQFLGYGMSGLTRRFLVKPTAMWWPGIMATVAIMTSFHKVETGEATGNRYTWSRFKVFWIASQPFLQTVSILCVFTGNGRQGDVVPQTGGGIRSNPAGIPTAFNYIAASTTNGVGLLGLTFDWTYVTSTYVTSPLWAVSVFIGGSIFFQWILTPIFFALDIWGINNKMTEDGNYVYFYNASDNYNLNITAYNDVAPVHITGFFALTYATSFLAITASISHVVLWYGKDIYRQTMNAFRQIRDEVDALDKHVKMMEAYPEIPDWAYLGFLAITTVAAVLVSVFTPFNMPWWAIFFNIFLCAIFILPFGVIQAISGFSLGLNVLTEFVIGLMIPGQTVAVMAFKSWGTNNLIQALALSQDLKLGQYLHIPPFAMVFAQFWGTLINAIVSTAACWYMMFNSGELLKDPNWRYNGYQVFYSAGGIWGAIGPQRFFGIGSLYQGLLWCFLVGAIAPAIPWLANKYVAKSSHWHLINFPLFFSLAGAGYNQCTFVVPLLVSWYCQHYLYKNNREFFQKYVYVIGSAFDAGSGLMSLVGSILAVADASYNDYGCEYYLDWVKIPLLLESHVFSTLRGKSLAASWPRSIT
ncbi:OPT superfamily oligopeptide transporter [Rhizoclosmatium globosum]|uniref:OPT superfamily oligopeptide transporter n=1 Tax=Rhizoclosmatium globosum TaxID=329046 RepID=A0A1Y2BZI6_9FUNG|nr:OPT superfamily oligopeptide transporter [Rhizoclosmatium globosum]|eukprot:ORY40178.1 OPT superfamily oligopeptide transporter [Rhizoclosmatium globosum]